MSKSIKRIMRDYKDIVNDSSYQQCFYVEPEKSKTINEEGEIIETENMYVWTGYIIGPEDTPYHNKEYKIKIKIPSSYPDYPPKITFVTKIWHPNIDYSGNICLDILKLPTDGRWSPVLSLAKVLLSIHSLLQSPNPNDPLNADAAKLYLSNREAFNAQVIAMKYDL